MKRVKSTASISASATPDQIIAQLNANVAANRTFRKEDCFLPTMDRETSEAIQVRATAAVYASTSRFITHRYTDFTCNKH
jgi:hypothetical protein